MSAIVGVYYLDDRPVEQAQLVKMTDCLIHRGRDTGDVWTERSIGFGHRMLWTTPESLTEKLPATDDQRGLTITADARIDNRNQLLHQLGLKHRANLPDSQIILAAYKKWGEDCPRYLIGDFAFAIWDAQRQQIFCARDPMGTKPLYYYCSGRLFAFASEMKTLFCLSEVPRELNELRLAYHLALFLEDKEITFYQNIFRLTPGYCLTISPVRKLQLRQYWALDPHRELKLSSDEEYLEAFREIFDEAVRCRLRSAFPIGSALSGGLDSSSIACTARKMLQKDQSIHTFSAIFPSLSGEALRWADERQYIESVKSIGGFESHTIRADQLNPLLDLLWQEEEPIPSPNLYIHNAMYDAAHAQGVRVFLDGVDGDTTISHGWRYLTELAYRGQWIKLNREIKAYARRFGWSRKQVFQMHCLDPLVIEPIQHYWRALRGRSTEIEIDSSLIRDRFAKQIRLNQQVEVLLKRLPAFTFTARQDHWLSMTTGLYPYAMEIADKAAMKHSIEPRYPFFDRRLMEFCLALPADQKFRNGWTRRILRLAMDGTLPADVQWRTTKGMLGMNFRQQLTGYNPKALSVTRESARDLSQYFDVSSVEKAFLQSSPESDMQLHAMATLVLWLRHLQVPNSTNKLESLANF